LKKVNSDYYLQLFWGLEKQSTPRMILKIQDQKSKVNQREMIHAEKLQIIHHANSLLPTTPLKSIQQLQIPQLETK
jgi:hypothetical protein